MDPEILEDGLRALNYDLSFVKSFQRLYEEQIMTDCTLFAEGSSIKAHKLVLSATCPYFEKIFSSVDVTNSNQYPLVILTEIKFGDLKSLVHYLYYGKVNMLQEYMPSFLQSARKLQIIREEVSNGHNGLYDNDSGTGNGVGERRDKGKKRKRFYSNQQRAMEVSESSDSEASTLTARNTPLSLRNTGFPPQNHQVFKVSDDSNDSIISPPELPPSTSFENTGNWSQYAQMGAYLSRAATEPQTVLQISGGMDDSGMQNVNRSSIGGDQSHAGKLTRGFTEEETAALVRAWNVESQRSTAAGALNLKRSEIIKSLLRENIVKNKTQISQRMTLMKKEFEAYKNSGIPTSLIAPHLDTLEAILAREPHNPRPSNA